MSYDPTHVDGPMIMNEWGEFVPAPPVFNPEGGGIPIKIVDYGGGGITIDPGPMPPVKLPAEQELVQVVIPDPVESNKKNNMLLIVGAGIAAYFLFFKK